MNGISNLTALIIASNDVQVSYGGPCNTTGKYVGWITLWKNERPQPLLNSEAIYDTPEDAKAAMQKIVDELKK